MIYINPINTLQRLGQNGTNIEIKIFGVKETNLLLKANQILNLKKNFE